MQEVANVSRIVVGHTPDAEAYTQALRLWGSGACVRICILPFPDRVDCGRLLHIGPAMHFNVLLSLFWTFHERRFLV